MQKGLTLIELLITIVVATILMGVAVPSYQQLKDNRILNDQASVLTSFIERAKISAVRSNKKIYFSLYKNNNSPDWCVGATDKISKCNCLTNYNECTVNDLVFYHADDRGVDITINNFLNGKGNQDFSFDGKRSTSSSGNIILSNNHAQIKIKISSMGRLSLCSDDGVGGYQKCS
ncbi:MAG: pilus assembly FimT family protein [Plesiomonas sp.]|uniref:pilus assembly FimT family protein n=1 Tax=Plesiomonas sp. TaxID=2486279 RepID=UPI003F2D7B45